MVELRPVDNFRICPSCLVSNSATDVFCTACGERLPTSAPAERAAGGDGVDTLVADADADADADAGADGSSGSAVDPTVELPAWPSSATAVRYTAAPPLPAASQVAAPAARRRRPRSLIAALIVAVAAVAAAATFGALWQVERQHADKLSSRLDTTRAQLDSTQTKLLQTEAKLAATTSLSEKRRAVLLKAQDVLGKVDPLLSSVDGVQARAGDLQDQGNTLSGDAEALIQTTITLVNYLVQTAPAYIDGTYVSNLIDQANGQLDSVRGDEYLFASDDTKYNSASATFGRKADAFSASVRALQKQLKGVATP